MIAKLPPTGGLSGPPVLFCSSVLSSRSEACMKIITFYGAVFLLAFLILLDTPSIASQHLMPISIQPLGSFPPELTALVKDELESFYAVAATVHPAQPLPKEAWYAPRSRWRADKLLLWLAGAHSSMHVGKVLGLTTQDISVTKREFADWGIFGLAQLGGRSGVVSTYRLRKGHASETLFRDRLRKIILHETGHLLGLPHCPTPGCLMEDARGTIAVVDAGSATLCASCDRTLRASGLIR